MKMVLRKIDELTQGDHHHITVNDNCYYFAEYPSGDNTINKNNPIYSLIHNLKKSVDRKNLPEWRYKGIAIRSCTSELRRLFETEGNIGDFTLVPIPPSKIRSNPLYDNRISQILEGLIPSFVNCDVRELLYCIEDREPSHYTVQRPSLDDIYDNYMIDESLINGVRNNIILFDDVLTNGTHFCASRRKLLERFPNSTILGLFIARRVFPEPAEDFNFADLF
ncbi:hypothetical protein [Sphingobacterium multivorum]|uniref:hypothetical protein n=1 Tax=Sphingobacterium multivorum TaxID=28454 RepID=UPI0028B1FF6E|nr:hypothetical protein [Sphingobacterium multivorum]